MDPWSVVWSSLTSLVVSGGAWKLIIEYRLKKGMEHYKSQLAKELERERHLAAQDLERFKSELTLPAEMRRLLAGKKLEALLMLFRKAEPLMRKFFNASVGPGQPNPLTELVHEFTELFQSISIYVDKKTVERLWGYLNTVEDATARRLQATDEKTLDAATKEAIAAYDGFMDLVRWELGIALAPASSFWSLPEINPRQS